MDDDGDGDGISHRFDSECASGKPQLSSEQKAINSPKVVTQRCTVT